LFQKNIFPYLVKFTFGRFQAKKFYSRDLCCLFVACYSSFFTSIILADEYRIGVLAYRGESQAMQTWVDTGEYLNKALAPHTFVVTPYDIPQMNKAVVNKEIDFAITQATHFVSMEMEYGISRIATIKRHYQGNDYTRYGAIIITKMDRLDIQELSDLNNKKIAAVSESALGGWQMAALEFDRENVQPAQIDFMGFPQSNIIYAVRDGLVDAGTVRARTFYELVDKGLISLLDYKVVAARTTQGYPFIHSTNLYPEWPIAKLSHTPKKLSETVVSALLAMNAEQRAAVSANISGWTVPMDYKPIFTLMQQLKIGPFELQDVKGLSSRIQNVVIVGMFFLLGFFVYLLVRRQSNSKHASSPSLIQQPQIVLKTDELYLKQLLLALDVVNDIVFILDSKGKISYLNRQASQLFEVESDELMGEKPEDIISFDSDDGLHLLPNWHKESEQHGVKSTGLLKCCNGKTYQLDIELRPLLDKQEKILGSIMILRDKSKSAKLENKIVYQASHDALTGLLNRGEFEAQLEETLEKVQSASFVCTLLYLDLDQFKLVNDSCGHIAGDELLKQVADEMVGITKNGEKIARIGGDEFAVLLKDCNLDQAKYIAERIRNSLDQFRFVWQERIFDISVSIGVLLVADKYKSVIEVLAAADAACYAAKHGGRNRIHVFTEDDNIIRRRRNEVQWAQELKYALGNDTFELACQPILSLKTQKENTNYLEVLVRMRDQQNNLVMPMAFIPAAERYSQMPAVDKWVVKKTVECLQEYKVCQMNSVRCFINISGQTISDVSFLTFVKDLLLETRLNPACLCFEITETATIVNFKQAAKLISVLQGMGCHFALDDFGTGLSSFSYLKQLPVDYIKIDGSFIRNMADDPVAMAIVEAISNICHTMNIEAIAEFVETEAILSNVKSINLDYVQGYVVSEPFPLSEMLKKIQNEQFSVEPSNL